MTSLAAALGRLDALLLAACEQRSRRVVSGVGLVVDAEEARELAAPSAPAPLPELVAENCVPLAWLAEERGLSAFDVDVVLLALAPELDRRYERVFAHLADAVPPARPTVGLALELLCGDLEQRLAARQRFVPDAPLVSERVIRLAGGAGLLAQPLELDEQVIAIACGDSGVDPRLAERVTLTSPGAALEDVPAPPETLALLAAVAASPRPPVVRLHGIDAHARALAADGLAAAAGLEVLRADARQLVAGELPLIVREAVLQVAALVLEHADVLETPERIADARRLLRQLDREPPALTVLDGEAAPLPVPGAGAGAAEPLAIEFPRPSSDVRLACWERALDGRVEPQEVALLARRYRLTSGQIAGAARAAVQRAELTDTQAGPRELQAAARARSGYELARLARRVDEPHRFEDLVLPDDVVVTLRAVCDRVGLAEAGGLAPAGVTVLFAGPSGTGKTMAASALANELGLVLERIDLATVVDKYIGETEKNLDRIFRAASGSNAVLLFDEADALFGKRSEVRDSHDRYANLEVSYLLQRMESYDGVAVLATNLRTSMDEAFARRLTFTVNFPFPDAAARRRLWRLLWPPQLSVAADVDLDRVADRLPLSGGNIRNIALAAGFLAGGDGAVSLEHLTTAIRREYLKLGKALPDAEVLALAPEPDGVAA